MGPKHPFADQFPNRLAWQFEKDLAFLAHTARTAEGLQRSINAWPAGIERVERLFVGKARRRDPEMGTTWRAFVTRKLAALPWPARPEQVQAITTSRARHVIHLLGGAPPDRHAGTAAAASVPAAVFFRGDTGERVQVLEAPPYLRRAGPVVETARPVGRPVAGGPQVYATQRQHAPGGPVPAGWVTEHVGRWNGRDTEVVYNPRRHQVMATDDTPAVAGALEANGWQRHATDGDRIVWTRDRLAATQTALARHDHAAAIGPHAPELRLTPGLER